MPYLQLDVPSAYPQETKRTLARRLGETYAERMHTTPRRVSAPWPLAVDGGRGLGGKTTFLFLVARVRTDTHAHKKKKKTHPPRHPSPSP